MKVNTFKFNLEDKNSEYNLNILVALANDAYCGYLDSPLSWTQIFSEHSNKLGLSKEQAEAMLQLHLRQCDIAIDDSVYKKYVPFAIRYVYKEDTIYHNYYENQSEQLSNKNATQKNEPLFVDAQGKLESMLDDYNAKEETANKYLPKRIFEEAPRLIKEVLRLYEDDRERDILFLSMLVVFSGCFPNYWGIYDRRKQSANLFLLIIAPPGAGKGCISVVRNLGNEIQKRLYEKYFRELKEYKELSDNRDENESSHATELKKPLLKTLFIPANITSAKIIECLARNIDFGITIDTEADTMTQALKSQHGGFSDLLRKAFQNETVEIARKKDDEHHVVSKTCLSLLLTGTPNQVSSLLNNVGNGLDTRFIYYDFTGNSEWRDVFEIPDVLPEVVFNTIGIELADYVEKLKCFEDEKEEINFFLSERQKLSFNKYFAEKHGLLKELYGDDVTGTIRRLGLIAWRIAMTLSIIRLIDEKEQFNKIICKDVDYDISLSVVDYLMEHSTRIFTLLHSMKKPEAGNQKIKDVDIYWDKLPKDFNRKEALEVASSLDINDKTSGNYLDKYIRTGKLIRVSHGIYSKQI